MPIVLDAIVWGKICLIYFLNSELTAHYLCHNLGNGPL